MSAIHITDSNFDEKVLKSEIPVLVDFWAPWCGPCQMAGPILDTLADKYKGKLVVAKINIDENMSAPGEYGVMSIPTVIMFDEGHEIDRQIGFAGAEGYEKMISKILG